MFIIVIRLAVVVCDAVIYIWAGDDDDDDDDDDNDDDDDIVIVIIYSGAGHPCTDASAELYT